MCVCVCVHIDKSILYKYALHRYTNACIYITCKDSFFFFYPRTGIQMHVSIKNNICYSRRAHCRVYQTRHRFRQPHSN